MVFKKFLTRCASSRIKRILLQLLFITALVVLFPRQTFAATLYWVGNDGANASVASNWKTTDPTTCGSGDSLNPPAAGDTINFDADCDNSAIWDSSAASAVSVMTLNSGYTGTVTLQRSLQTTSTFTQSGGIFNSSNQTLDVDGAFTMNTGAGFTAPSTTMTVAGNFTINGGTFTHNSGTVTFDGAAGSTFSCNDQTFNTVSISETTGTGSTSTIGSNCNLPLAGTNPTITTSRLVNNGTISATGNLTMTVSTTSTAYTHNAGAVLSMTGTTLTITGVMTLNGGTLPVGLTTLSVYGLDNSGNVLPNGLALTLNGGGTTASLNCGTVSFGSVTINKSSGNLTVDNGCILPIAGTNPTITIGNGGTLINNGRIDVTGNPTFSSSYTQGTTGVLTITGTTVTVVYNLTLNGGTFANGLTNLTVKRDLNNSGNVLPNNLVLTLDDLSGGTITCGTVTFNSVTINKTSNNSSITTIDSSCTLPIAGTNPTIAASVIDNYGTINVTGNLTINNNSLDGYEHKAGAVLTMTGTILDVNGSMTLTGGTFPAGITTITVSDDFINSGDILPNGIALTLDGTPSNLNCGTANYSSITINLSNATNTTTPQSNCTANAFTLSQGILGNPASAYTYYVAGDFTESANTTLGGGNLTVSFNGSGNQSISKTAGTFSSPFTVNKSGGALSLSTAFTTSGQTCTIAEGTFDVNGQTFTCGSTFTVEDGGNFQLKGSESVSTPALASASMVTFDGTTGPYTVLDWDYHHLTLNGTGGTFNLGTNETVAGNFTITNGTINSSSGTLNVAGTFSNSGTFNHNNGTVNFNGSSQTIAGTSTFNNLTKNVGVGATFTFPASATQTILGTLDLQGVSGGRLMLRSSTPDTQWRIDPQGARTLAYLDVKDSNNINATAINAQGTGSVDSGNNTNWLITEPTPTPTPTNTPTPTPTTTPTPTSTPTPTAIPASTNTPTPTPTSVSSSTNSATTSSSSTTNSPVCNNDKPSGVPDLFMITTTETTATLYYVPARGTMNAYYVLFGPEEDKEKYGASFSATSSTGVEQLNISELEPGTTYYFKMRAGNGCATGEWSSFQSATTTVKQTSLFTQPTKLEITEVEQKPLAKTEQCSYVVQPGDSLWSIAEDKLGSGVKYPTLIQKNKAAYPTLTTDSFLSVGWKLKLPTCDTKTVNANTVKEKKQLLSLTIKVVDNNQEPVEGAKVTVHSTPQEALTDKNGIAAFRNVEPGEHEVAIAYDNSSGTQKLFLDNDKKEVSFTVQIKPSNPFTNPFVILVVTLLLVIIFILLLILKRRKIITS